MAQPVWTLSVDLQTKTATFTSGLSDAAKAARGSFTDIKSAAADMEGGVRGSMRDTGYSMMGARHGVMLLGEEFGVHLPRGITTFIASIGPVGTAMEAAFPFLAIIVGATLLINHLSKLDEAAKKAAESQTKAFDASAKSLEEASAKGLELQIRLAELVGGPTTALELKLRSVKDILESMKLAPELKREFEDLAKGIQVPSLWNPLNWFGDSRTQSKEVKAEADSAGLAIANASSLEEKRTIAYTELTKAQLNLASIQKSGNNQAIEDQKMLIRLLQQTAEAMTQQVTNQKTESKVKDAERAEKEAREQEKIDKAREAGLDHRFKLEAEYAAKGKKEREKESKDEEELAASKMKADEAYYSWVAKQEEERARRGEELSRENAQHSMRMAKLGLQADMEQGQLKVTYKRNQYEQLQAVELEAEHRSYMIQLRAYSAEIAGLDKSGKDYNLKLVQLHNHQAELTKQHENNITSIKTKATQERNMRILSAERQLQDETARGLSQVIMRHQSFAQMLNTLGDQMVSGMIQNALKSMMAMDMTKERDAAAAARKAFLAGWHFPFPVNLVMGPALGAMAFAAAMAFEGGGIVPGIEKGDVVPIRATPGEAILPKPLTEGLTNAARSGNMGGKGDTHIRYAPTYHIQTIDGDGIRGVLAKHKEVFTAHVMGELRRRNA